MKKLMMIVTVLAMFIMMIGADIRRKKDLAISVAQSEIKKAKKPCYGYTIIEFGKGINCDGDTVKLVKVNGGQALAN